MADTASPAAPEVARKSLQALLQRLAKADLATIAKAIGKSESTACRLRDGEASLTPQEFCALLEAVGFKLVDVRKYCVDREVYEAMSTMATRAMSNPDIARQLVWDDN